MGALKQSLAFIVAGLVSGATLAYIDAYHVLEITEGFKFRTPPAVWRFQFNIWWPVILVMGLLFAGASQLARVGLKADRDSTHLLSSSFAAIALAVVLYLLPKLLDSSAALLTVLILGPIAAATLIESGRKP